MRRPLLFLACAAIAGCAHSPVEAPSLYPRPAEAIDPRIPVPDPVLSTTPSPGLVAQLTALIGQAEAGDSEFQPAASAAEKAAAAAGAPQSEGWVAAQQALSVAVAARAPVTRAAADLDSLGAQRIQKLGGIAAADLKAIDAASAKVQAIDNREAATIKGLQERLGQ